VLNCGKEKGGLKKNTNEVTKDARWVSNMRNKVQHWWKDTTGSGMIGGGNNT